MVEIWRSKKSQWVGCWDVVVGLFDFKLRWTCWWSTWKIRVNKIVRISICLMKMVVANDDHSIDWFLIDYWSSDRAIDIHKWTCKPQYISFLRTCASQNSSINVQVYCGDIGFLPPIKWVPTICTPAMSLFSISKITFHELIGRDAPKREKKKHLKIQRDWSHHQKPAKHQRSQRTKEIPVFLRIQPFQRWPN